MKTVIAPWRLLYSEIDDAITHSQKEGLPLESIELSADEWKLFLWGHEHFKVAHSKFRATQESMVSNKEARYLGVKIYEGKA